ncbi:MAG: asparaginase [Propionibacterium sp.]|nr:MAG: asparaginase [Propionibacterium sp.]
MSVIVAEVSRNGFVESTHAVDAVVVGADRSILRSWGVVDQPMLPRSANKPMQAIGMLQAGAKLAGPALAIATASHSGMPQHLDAVRASLAASGLDESYLANTADYPINEDARDDWIRAGNPKTSLTQNCSGKHAGMLAACVAAGWDLAGYRDPDHPLQRVIAEVVADCSGDQISATVCDGCGAPAFAITLTGLAWAFGRIAAATSGPAKQVADAMRAHPELVAAEDRSVTRLMRGIAGAVVKDGAEGVIAAGLPDGTGIALKVIDGSARARDASLTAILAELGVGEPRLLEEVGLFPILGHGEPVGRIITRL